MHSPRSIAIAIPLLALLVATTTGCASVGKAALWPVKQTAELAFDLTAFTAKTTISVAANTVQYTARKTVDLAFDVAGGVLENELVEEVVGEAVAVEVGPAAKILKDVLD